MFQKLCAIRKETLRLTIVGDGPMKQVLKKKVQKRKKNSFLGKIPHKKLTLS